MLTNDKDFLFSSNEAIQFMKAHLQRSQGLSKRESEVVMLVVQGLTNKQVADQLCVAEKNRKFHLTNVYKRMKIRRRSEIIWSLPIAEFRERIKNNTLTTAPVTTTNPSPATVDENSIPVGSSTVTDNLDIS